MTLPTSEYEYKYSNSNLTHAHDYLTTPLLSFLTEKVKPGAKILDLGCGNGSFTNVIAQQGYQAVGMEESPSGVAMAQKNFPQCRFLEGSIYVPPH
jgi:cyclopropane fatty-acyl-phospholipid synthase-like methyltransferase